MQLTTAAPAAPTAALAPAAIKAPPAPSKTKQYAVSHVPGKITVIHNGMPEVLSYTEANGIYYFGP